MHEKNKIYKNEQQIVLKKKNEYFSEKKSICTIQKHSLKAIGEFNEN